MQALVHTVENKSFTITTTTTNLVNQSMLHVDEKVILVESVDSDT